ncbi:MAG: C25 family cysteine peptidase [Granulosicoccus sp.]
MDRVAVESKKHCLRSLATPRSPTERRGKLLNASQKRNKFTLAVMADVSSKTMRTVARRLVTELESGSPSSQAAWQVEFMDSGEPFHSKNDPFSLQERVQQSDADAFVLVVPSRWGARRLLPAPVVDGRPVAIVQADHCSGIGNYRGSPDATAPWVVAAMAKDVFLKPTDQWAKILSTSDRRVLDLRADRARRTDLLQALSAGPRVVLYAGHGRNRGWAGYQALRLAHFTVPERSTPARSIGLVVAFACDTLTRTRSRVPFGSELVRRGIVHAYLGAADTIYTADAEALSVVILRVLANDKPTTVLELMRMVDNQMDTEPAAQAAWRKFRLIGDPTTLIE